MEVATGEIKLDQDRVSVRRNHRTSWRPVTVGCMRPVEHNSDDYVVVKQRKDGALQAEYYVAGDRAKWYHQLLGISKGLVLELAEGQILAFNRRGVVTRQALHRIQREE